MFDPAQVLDRPATALSRIGNTPLLELAKLSSGLPGVRILAKAEYLNPGGSVKDRPAWNMVRQGLDSGALRPGKTLLDASSGNTGIAYAMIGASFGFPVKLCIPANASPVTRRMMRAYGADLVLTDPALSSDGAILEARRLLNLAPDRYFYPDQYNNPANWQAHYEGTGREILSQTRGEVTHFVAGLGTSGTFTGVTRRLREEAPDVRCISVQPSTGFHGLEGLKHMESAIVPGFYDPTLADENFWAETEDAYEMVRRAGKEEGLLLGPSSGANLWASLEVGRRAVARGSAATIVTILCDGAAKYIDEPFWEEK